MTWLSQGFGNGCIRILVKNLDLDGADVDVWGLDDFLSSQGQYRLE
jgi:hypothetical protein